MKISESNNLIAEQKEAIFKLWNNEYPIQVSYKNISELEDYLSKLKNQSHYLAIDENNIIRGWAFTFERDNEKWFAIILDASVQRKAIGSSLLNILKEKESVLNAWVVDHNKSIKQNGEIYQAPLSFYLKNDFIVCSDIRLETEKISAVKIKWVIENDEEILKSQMKLQTERLRLREVIFPDLENIHELHSLPETDKYNTLGIPSNIEETKQYVSGLMESQNELPRNRYVFCIENKEQKFIGLVGINIGKPKYRIAEIWYKLHPKFWNQGYATEVVKCILNYCFTELNLHRVEAGCATANIASIKVLEKCEFIKEGLRRKKLPIRGEWIDNYEYAILDEDYSKLFH